MKTCKQCGKEYPDNISFCGVDGSPLTARGDSIFDETDQNADGVVNSQQEHAQGASPTTDPLAQLKVIKSREYSCYFPDMNGSFLVPDGAAQQREIANGYVQAFWESDLPMTMIGLGDWKASRVFKSQEAVMLRTVRRLGGVSEAIVDIQLRKQGKALFVQVKHYNFVITVPGFALRVVLKYGSMLLGLVLLFTMIKNGKFSLDTLFGTGLVLAVPAVIVYAVFQMVSQRKLRNDEIIASNELLAISVELLKQSVRSKGLLLVQSEDQTHKMDYGQRK